MKKWRVRAEVTDEFDFYVDFETVNEANDYFDKLYAVDVYDVIIVYEVK